MSAETAVAAPSAETVLDAAVQRLGGEHRLGQLRMAHAVAAALDTGEHLLVQAGTGTGKSLGYLIPALLHDARVVIATATLTLQHQLVERDIPALLEAAEPVLGRRPSYAVLKGRSNYACLHRARDGVPDDQGTLVDVPTGALGRQVLELREWVDGEAESGGSGDRDGAPTHTDRAWSQISVSARDCLGANRCPYGEECFAERAREQAMAAELVVTNHALLAIDALENIPVLPEHEAVVVDEAHELAARVTGVASAELNPTLVEWAAKRARAFVDAAQADELADAGEALGTALLAQHAGRVETLTGPLADALVLVRDAARAAWSAFPSAGSDSDNEAPRRQARGLVEQVREVADRVVAASPYDVTWVAEPDRLRLGKELRVAPLTVAGLLREHLFTERTVVMTSATLRLGGDFDAVARGVGLRPSERLPDEPVKAPAAPAEDTSAGGASGADDKSASGRDGKSASGRDGKSASGRDGNVSAGSDNVRADSESDVQPMPWRGIDVGSPFSYATQAILYLARTLPPPGRDGLGQRQIDEICALVAAAGGRTLGLFSSRRAAEAAATAARERLAELPILCQGDEQLSSLRERFAAEPRTSLFGTLSLWQGLDVPGETCRLVIIDRIPFPRPDDPLMSARQRAVDEAGGNGFMTVAAAHAALMLAQGTGRLIRTATDRGLVAILDPRLVTARYGSYLRASLPPMWPTTDRDVALSALRRLGESAAGG